MRRLQAFLALTGLTAVDTFRQPIVLLIVTACVTLTAVTPMLLLQPFGEYGKLARESGLAFQFVFGLLLAVQAACGQRARDAREGTVAAVLSKPVGRPAFLLARFAGITLVLAAFSLGAIVTTLLAARVAEQWTVTAATAGDLIDWRTGVWLLAAPAAALAGAGLLNYRLRLPLASTGFLLLLAALLTVLLARAGFDRAGNPAPFDCRVDWRIVPAGILLACALAILAALAVSLAAHGGGAATLTVCGAVLALGLLWEPLLGPPPAGLLPGALYSLVPNWQQFWVSDALIGGGRIPWSYVGGGALYAAATITLLLALGILAFERSELPTA